MIIRSFIGKMYAKEGEERVMEEWLDCRADTAYSYMVEYLMIIFILYFY